MKSVKQKHNPKDCKWPAPKIHLHKELAVISSFLGLASFLITSRQDDLKLRIGLSVVILVATYILIQAFLLVAKIIFVIYKRINYYPSLYNLYKNAHSRLREVEQEFVSYVSNSTKRYMFEIARTTYQGNQLYLSLKKKDTFNLNVNDVIIVIDKNDLYYMGQFKVTEIRTDIYYAVGTKHIDPVWLSFVMRKEEVEMTPNLVACCKKIGE